MHTSHTHEWHVHTQHMHMHMHLLADITRLTATLQSMLYLASQLCIMFCHDMFDTCIICHIQGDYRRYLAEFSADSEPGVCMLMS